MSSSGNTNRAPPPPPYRSALRPYQVSIMAPMYAPLAVADSSSGSGSGSGDDNDEEDEEENEEEDEEENEDEDEDEEEAGGEPQNENGAEEAEDDEDDEGSVPRRPTISPLTPPPRRDHSAWSGPSPSTDSSGGTDPNVPLSPYREQTPSPSPGASNSPAASANASPTPSTTSSRVIDPDIPLSTIEGPPLDCETRLRRARREARRSLNHVRRALGEEAEAVRRLLAEERKAVRQLTRRLRRCEEHRRAMEAHFGRLPRIRREHPAREQPAREVKRAVGYAPVRE